MKSGGVRNRTERDESWIRGTVDEKLRTVERGGTESANREWLTLQ